MALVDAITLPIIKTIYTQSLPVWYMLLPVMMYSVQPLIFYFSMGFSGVTTMNLVWDLSSDIVVTLIGLFYLREKLGKASQFGLFFGFVAIAFFAYETYLHSEE